MNEQPGSQQLPGSGPISDRVYVWLRQRILAGDIKPGELIDEKNIGARFSVSRTPVREAVKRLSDEHLVDVVAQSATRAATLDKDAIHEAYLIRPRTGDGKRRSGSKSHVATTYRYTG
jgi:DNA-binding GntR family transcriptional regulator